MSETPGPGRQLASALVSPLLTRLDALTDRLVNEILADNRGYQVPGSVQRHELYRSCRDNIERVLQLIGEVVPEGVDPFDAPRRTGARRAEERVPLDAVLRSYRLGGRIIWEGLVGTAQDCTHAAPVALLEAATSVWSVVDTVSSQVSHAYHEAEIELLRADEKRRAVLIDELLRGRGRDRGFAQNAMLALDLPSTGDYVVVAAEQVADACGSASARTALAAHGVRSVWQARAEAQVGLVALEQRPVEAVLAALRPQCRARVGVSPVVDGPGELGVAHELALIALRTAVPGTRDLIALDDRWPEALVVHAPELADRLVRANLGGALDLPPADREVLLGTLDTWLETGCSAARTAQRLHCHRNTVVNRLSRLGALTGRPLQGRDRFVALSLALSALRLGAGGLADDAEAD